MFTLRAFLVCEKVIFDKDTSVPTVVGIIQGIKIEVPNMDIPKNAMTPNRWTIFTWWIATDEEHDKSIGQCFELFSPDGTIAFPKQIMTFRITEPSQRNASQIFGFPIGLEGEYRLKMWLEEEGNRISDEYFYPIKIEYTRNDEAPMLNITKP